MIDYLLRHHAPLTAQEWRAVDDAAVQVARRNLVGRRFLSLFGPVGVGVQTFAADAFGTAERARISLFGTEEEDLLTVESRRFVPLPILYRDFRLDWRDLETARRLGTPLDTTATAIAATSVAAMEDRLIVNGYDELQQEGFLNAGGRQQLPLGDWNTVGGAFSAVVSAVAALAKANFRGPFSVVVPPQLFVSLNRVYGNTGVLEIDQVRKLVGGGVFASPAMPEGKAVVVAAGPENMDLIVAQDLTVAFLETTSMEHHFRVLEVLSLRIKRPGAICTLGQV